jgi:hypothetical protein
VHRGAAAEGVLCRGQICSCVAAVEKFCREAMLCSCGGAEEQFCREAISAVVEVQRRTSADGKSRRGGLLHRGDSAAV